MKRFIAGQDRTQSTLLPELLDEYITEENPVRVIDLFVDGLDLKSLGFDGVVPADTGRPSYHPAVLLKLYVYGYLNRIQSTRRLETEALRNVELMWLIARLTPDFKTIANFRRENGKAIRKICAQFIELCRQMNLFTDAMVAVDGSKFKAVNSSDQNFTQTKIKRRMQEAKQSIAQYLKDLETADLRSPAGSTPHQVRLAERIELFKKQMNALQAIKEQVQVAPDKQVSISDPDARSMQHRGGGIVGYNVQAAVDTKNHLIVAHELTNIGHDRSALATMANQAKEALQVTQLTVVADKGYYSGQEIKDCMDSGVTPIVPKCKTSSNRSNGLFDKNAFIYHPDQNEYECPAGEALIERFKTVEHGKNWIAYWIQLQNLHPKAPVHYRNKQKGQALGATHFLTKTKEHVSTKMSLHIVAYKLKRVMKIMGSSNLLRAMATSGAGLSLSGIKRPHKRLYGASPKITGYWKELFEYWEVLDGVSRPRVHDQN